jgi:hypothetical protein
VHFPVREERPAGDNGALPFAFDHGFVEDKPANHNPLPHTLLAEVQEVTRLAGISTLSRR